MGDPAGIGPEIAVRLARAVAAGKTSSAEIFLYGAPDVIGKLCVIGSKIDEQAIAELFGV